MPTIHIVGADYSFTHDATKQRYGIVDDGQYTFIDHEHPELVSSLLDKKISPAHSAVVPLWNSNTGTVNFDRQTKTADLFLKARPVHDLWPQQIIFKLAIKNKHLTDESNIFSVKVARSQCSLFLKQIKLLDPDRFKEHPSTTAAADSFIDNAQLNDGLLCSEALLNSKRLKSSDVNVTNPHNFTIFSTFNTIPSGSPNGCPISLGCVLVNLTGNELPTEFIRYYKNLLTMEEIQESQDVSFIMPKILFIWRYESSKALLLLEMDVEDYTENPWPPPDIDSEESELQEWDFCDQVGRIYEPFSGNIVHLFTNIFDVSKECVFYGYGDCYTWVCPALNISVQGFDKDLVKTCAKTQVLHLKDLVDAGNDVPLSTKHMLRLLQKDEANLKLAADSEPDGP